MSISNELAKSLLQIQAIKLQPSDPFTWASGWESPIYCDNRLSLSYPEVRDLVKKGLVELAGNWEGVDVIVGVATAGIPHGALLADALDKPFAYVRSKAKEHGRQNQIEGRILPGQKVLIVEDLISTGGSLIKACQPIRDVGASIVGALALFTYDFEISRMKLKSEELPFQTITDYPTLVEEALKLSYISTSDLDTLRAWRQSPDTWHAL